MAEHGYEASLVQDRVPEPMIYVHHEDGLPYSIMANDCSEIDALGWRRFATRKKCLYDISESPPHLRHGFLLDIPDPLSIPPAGPTLPLHSPDRDSLRCHAPQLGYLGLYISSWFNSVTLYSPINSIFVYAHSLSLWNSQFAWLLLYFSLNLLLTLSNKTVLTAFPFPYTLTAIHALFSTLGGTWLRWCGAYTSKHLNCRSELVLAGFSFLYAINIAVSNISLNLVTVPFHQVVRAVTPVFTILLSTVFFNTEFSKRKLVSLTPVIFGVVMATYGDYYFTAWGFCLTLFGTFLAALKTIFTNILQTSPNLRPSHLPRSRVSISEHPKRARSDISLACATVSLVQGLLPPPLELHPLDLLARMSPLAFVQCVICAHMSGELDRVRQFSAGNISSLKPLSVTVIHGIDQAKVLLLLLNGCIAFGLNVVSFFANGKVGPLSMTVAGNVKQVLTILSAVSLFNLTITPLNGLGITITLLGGVWYAWEEYRIKTRKARRTASLR